MSTAFVSLAGGILAVVLGAIFYAARLGFENPAGPVLKTVGLSLFLLALPELWRSLMARVRHADQWFAAPGFAAVVGLGLLTLAGLAGAASLALVLAPLGALFFAAAAIRCVRAAPRRALLLVIGSAGFSLWAAALAWGYGYMNPLFVESIAARTAPKTVVDTLFHTSIANMISVHGQPSTGLDGVVPLRYHVGSHWLFVQLARLLDLSLLDFYQLGFPVLMFPLLFASLLWFALALRGAPAGSAEPAPAVPGAWFWAVFVAGIVGILPLEAQAGLAIGWWRPISESYTVSLVLAFGLLSALALLWRRDRARDRQGTWSPARALFLLVVLPAGVSVCGFSKSSTMFLMVAAASYAYLRLELYKDPVWRISVPLIVGLSLLVTWLLRIPGFAKPSPLHFVATYVKVGWRPLWVAGYFMWVWVFVALRLQRAGVRSLGDLRARLLERSLVDLEILGVVAALGAVPGFLVAIGGQSTGYFSDPQRWLAVALLLSVLAVAAPAAPAVSPSRVSPWGVSLRYVAAWAFGLMLAGVTVANGYALLKQFAKANLETRRRLFGNRPLAELLRGSDAARRALAAHPEHRLLRSLRDLDRLPRGEKARSALWVPKSNELYWKLLPECLTPSFLGPALAGLPMLSGLPSPECERQRLGYWSYRLRPGGWGTDLAEGDECERALHLGFGRVVRVHDAARDDAVVGDAKCDGAAAAGEKP